MGAGTVLNRIVIMGRLTRDPELRYTQSKTPVAAFTLAVDRDFGEKATDFIDCVAWRQTAEFVSKYFAKGAMAVVAGRLQLRDWTDRDGNKRRSAEVIVESVYFGEAKRREERTADEANYAAEERAGRFEECKAAPGAYEGFSELADADGELPF